MLSRNGHALQLTRDCKASRPDETARIVAAGGFVSNGRVRGALAVSRALGDAQYKAGGQELVTSDAELYRVSLNKEAQQEDDS